MTDYNATYTIPGSINSSTVNDAPITNGSKFETSYHVSSNVGATYDSPTSPTSMSLSYSSSTSPATSFMGTKYNPVSVAYFHGTIHECKVGGYAGATGTKGEIVIKHVSVDTGGNKTLLVHIPTISTDSNLHGISKAAEIFQGRGDGEANPPFTANDILPRKPFLYYVNGSTTSIVIIPTDNTCYVEIPDEYLKGFASATNLSTPNSTLAYKYSSELPAYGTHLLKDDIYIDCSPTGASDTTEWAAAQDITQAGLDGLDAEAAEDATRKTMMYVFFIILSILVPLVLIVCFWYFFKFITGYLKPSGTTSPG